MIDQDMDHDFRREQSMYRNHYPERSSVSFGSRPISKALALSLLPPFANSHLRTPPNKAAQYLQLNLHASFTMNRHRMLMLQYIWFVSPT